MTTSTLTSDIKSYFNRIKLQESYASIVLGAIVVIVLGLLVANYFTKGAGQIGTAETTMQNQAEISQMQKTYKVVAGDSLSIIAQRQYGNMEYWPVIARANNIADPNVISSESSLVIPAKAEADKIQAEMTMTSYQVQNGDTPFMIAEKAYGDGSMWTIIAHANNVGYLENGNPLIFTGSTLSIPR